MLTQPELLQALGDAGKLLLATALGALVGLERQLEARPAGLRTHMLVALGAALLTIVSMSLSVTQPGYDPSRIAAGIVTGIGFLGAGTIIRERDGNGIRGLTTAASVWVVSAVGIAVGSGGALTLLGIVVAVLTWAILRSKYLLEPDRQR